MSLSESWRRLEARDTTQKRTLFVSCVGSHMWGMESEESDVDLVRIYIVPTCAILRGERISPSIRQRMTESGGMIYDILGWEAGHLTNQLIKGNVNAIWYATSPLVLQPSPVQERLQDLVQGNLCRETYHSVRGMAESQIAAGQRPERWPGKGYRTALRTMNFGIELLSRGRLCFEPVRHTPHQEEVMERLQHLSDAYEASALPDLPDQEAFREFLLRLRLEEMAQG